MVSASWVTTPLIKKIIVTLVISKTHNVFDETYYGFEIPRAYLPFDDENHLAKVALR